jgi:Na+-transporting methylmalonyl-CoA/oxaloacetate decarboxylase gamma subunit
METVAIDWGEAWQISGMGFGLVFLVLAMLAIAIWLIGLVLRRMDGRGSSEATDEDNEPSPPEAAD